jgi:Domain of unknown function (DUF4180)
MSDTLITINNRQVLNCTPDGKKLSGEEDALKIISKAMSKGADMVAMPVARLDEAFFELKSQLAGQIVQKFVTYRKHLVILGDITSYLTESRSFHDFVYELNLGNQIWFLPNMQELTERLNRPN